MKTIICFFLMIILSVAADVNVYVYSGCEFYGKKLKAEPRDFFTFGYNLGDVLSMHIYLKIEDLNVTTDLYVQYSQGDIQKLSPKKSSKGSKYFEIWRILNDTEMVIDLESNTTTGISSRNQIVKGIDVTGLSDPIIYENLYNDICLKGKNCVIKVDLLNNANTERPAPQQSSQINVLTYVIPSIIVLCTIITLVIYLSFKKCHPNSRPESTMELNTFTAANEVVYADLSLANGDRQPPRRDEDSPYAEIIVSSLKASS